MTWVRALLREWGGQDISDGRGIGEKKWTDQRWNDTLNRRVRA